MSNTPIKFIPAFRSLKTDEIVVSPKHHDIRNIPRFRDMSEKQFLAWIMDDNDDVGNYIRDNWEECFVDKDGKYYSRAEASNIASSLRGEYIPGESNIMRDYGLMSKANRADLVKLADLCDRYRYISQANMIDQLLKMSGDQDLEDIVALYKVHDEIKNGPLRLKEYQDSHTFKTYMNVVISLLRRIQYLVNDKVDRLDGRTKEFCQRYLDKSWKSLDDIDDTEDLHWKRINIEHVLNSCHNVLEELLWYFKEGKEFKGIIV